MKIWITILMTGLLGGAGFSQDETGFEEEVYKKIDSGEGVLKMRIYKPKGWSADDKRPAIVFFFGGGWRGGSPKQFHQHSLKLAELGMVAMAAEYRIKNVHQSTPFQSTSDARSAIRWARENAAKLGVDPKRLAAGGGSAGGHLAAATATISTYDSKTDPLDVNPIPNALVLFNPALDLQLEGMRKNWGDEIYAKASTISPIEHVTEALPPTIIFHGKADDTVPIATAEGFVKKAEEKGVKKVELVGYDGEKHGFFNFGRGGNVAFDDTMKRTFGFFRELGWLE